MTDVEHIETPAVLVDLDRVRRNLGRIQDAADKAGIANRPHIKTHKIPMLAKMQVDCGAVGITCQKLAEAEVMTEHGLSDIFLPYNIVGGRKLARMRRLAETCDLSVTADNVSVVDGYASAMRGTRRPLPVLVECDTGMGRCGVQTPEECLAVARRISQSETLHFAGLMTYPAAGRHAEANRWLDTALEALRSAGLSAARVSTGGSPDLRHAIGAGPATEYRPGTYIYMDRSLADAGVCSQEDCALRVLATVVARPAQNRAVIDAGSKSLTTDLLGLDGFGLIPAHPEARIASLSEEHGVVDVSNCPAPPDIGARLEIIPNHACVVSNLFDFVWMKSSEERAPWPQPVAARGCVV